jgi:hypothetical protein
VSNKTKPGMFLPTIRSGVRRLKALKSKLPWFLVMVLLALLALSFPHLVDRFRFSKTHGVQDEQLLGVATLVRQVQSEIEKSEEERKEKNIAPMFELRGFEVEIAFVVRKTNIESGQAKFEAFAVDDRIEMSSERTHRLKLIMDPATSYEDTVGPSNSAPPNAEVPSGRVPRGSVSAGQMKGE